MRFFNDTKKQIKHAFFITRTNFQKFKIKKLTFAQQINLHLNTIFILYIYYYNLIKI